MTLTRSIGLLTCLLGCDAADLGDEATLEQAATAKGSVLATNVSATPTNGNVGGNVQMLLDETSARVASLETQPGTAGPEGPAGPAGPAGAAGPAGPAGGRPAPPCFSNSGRYVNCQNGTVTDSLTGLVWLQKTDCGTANTHANYAIANQTVTTLGHGVCGLTDGSSPGDWRLPTVEEWRTTVQAAKAHVPPCNPAVTDDSGFGCAASSTSFIGLRSGSINTARNAAWASTTTDNYGWLVNLNDGVVYQQARSELDAWVVWAVRR